MDFLTDFCMLQGAVFWKRIIYFVPLQCQEWGIYNPSNCEISEVMSRI